MIGYMQINMNNHICKNKYKNVEIGRENRNISSRLMIGEIVMKRYAWR